MARPMVSSNCNLSQGLGEVDAKDEETIAFGGCDQSRLAIAGHVIDASMFDLGEDAFVVHSRIFLKLGSGPQV